MRRFIHIVATTSAATLLSISLLGCTCLSSECPTPPADKLAMGDLSALATVPATPSPDALATPPRRVLVPGVAAGIPTLPPAQRIQEYLPGVEVRVYAGTGQVGGLDGPGGEACFDGPFGLAIGAAASDSASPGSALNLYVTELSSGRVRVIDPAGSVWTWIGNAGSGTPWPSNPSNPFLHPRGVAVGPRGQVYIVDSGYGLTLVEGGRLVRLSSGITGFRDGPVAEAAFHTPGDVVLGPGDALCLSDARNNRIRLLTATGTVGTLAGSGTYGYRDGPALGASFTHPNGLAFDAQGLLYIADGGALGAAGQDANACIRVLSPTGQVSTYAGTNQVGYVDGLSAEARFSAPLLGLAFDGTGNLYVADMNNHVVRMVTREGRVLTVAGTGNYGLRSGSGSEAMLGLPADIVWDGHNALYVTDYGDNVIWQITLPSAR